MARQHIHLVLLISALLWCGEDSTAIITIMKHCPPRRYIVGFYRTEQKTIWDSVRTVFTLHNETVNVWSHFLGELDSSRRQPATVL